MTQEDNELIDDFLTEEQKREISSFSGGEVEFSLVGVNLRKLKDLGDTGGSESLAEIYLSEEEEARFHGYTFRKRRYEWLGGRIAAKAAAMKFIHSDINEIKWKRLQVNSDENGKPCLVLKDKVSSLPQISISHSSQYAVAMASDIPCGIDLQEITPRVLRFQEKFVGEAEIAILPPEKQGMALEVDLTRVWSAKEALRKFCSSPPLPGFLEMSLCGMVKETGAGLILSVSCPEKCGGLNMEKNVLIYTLIADGYAFAVTFGKGE